MQLMPLQGLDRCDDVGSLERHIAGLAADTKSVPRGVHGDGSGCRHADGVNWRSNRVDGCSVPDQLPLS